MRLRTPILIGLLASASAATVAQEFPPTVLAVTREEIKPGKMSAHERQAASYVALIGKASPDSYRLGLTPVTGSENVVVYMEGYHSFEAVGEARNATAKAIASNAAWKAEMDRIEIQGGELHVSQQAALFRYRHDLSYRPPSPSEVARARFLTVTMVRITPGRVPDYADYLKALNKAWEKVGLNVSRAVYQVQSGLSTNTFLFLVAQPSLKQIDDINALFEARQKAIDTALGGHEVVKQRRMMLADVIADTVTNVYAVAPAISRPSPEFAAADPDFWTPKAAAAPTKPTAADKGGSKP